MKKLENLGKVLSKEEQKKIRGGNEEDDGETGTCGSWCDLSCKRMCNGVLTNGSCAWGTNAICYCSVVC